jgi:hypothetical protein
MELPTIEVRAQGLAVEAVVRAAGRQAPPNVINYMTSAVMVYNA